MAEQSTLDRTQHTKKLRRVFEVPNLTYSGEVIGVPNLSKICVEYWGHTQLILSTQVLLRVLINMESFLRLVVEGERHG